MMSREEYVVQICHRRAARLRESGVGCTVATERFKHYISFANKKMWLPEESERDSRYERMFSELKDATLLDRQ